MQYSVLVFALFFYIDYNTLLALKEMCYEEFFLTHKMTWSSTGFCAGTEAFLCYICFSRVIVLENFAYISVAVQMISIYIDIQYKVT